MSLLRMAGEQNFRSACIHDIPLPAETELSFVVCQRNEAV
jgi:hypothetical protein